MPKYTITYGNQIVIFDNNFKQVYILMGIPKPKENSSEKMHYCLKVNNAPQINFTGSFEGAYYHFFANIIDPWPNNSNPDKVSIDQITGRDTKEIIKFEKNPITNQY